MEITDIDYWKEVLRMLMDPNTDETTKGMLEMEWSNCPKSIQSQVKKSLGVLDEDLSVNPEEYDGPHDAFKKDETLNGKASFTEEWNNKPLNAKARAMQKINRETPAFPEDGYNARAKYFNKRGY